MTKKQRNEEIIKTLSALILRTMPKSRPAREAFFRDELIETMSKLIAEMAEIHSGKLLRNAERKKLKTELPKKGMKMF